MYTNTDQRHRSPSRQHQVVLSDHYDREPLTAEYLATQDDATLLISGRWIRDIETGTLTYYRTELAWNYVENQYNEYSYDYDVGLKNDGKTVVHTGKHWLKHAQDVAEKTKELRPRIDSYYRVNDPEIDGINQWINSDIHFESVAAAIQSISL